MVIVFYIFSFLIVSIVFCLFILFIEYFIMQNIRANTAIMLISIPTTGTSYFITTKPAVNALYIKYDNPIPIGIPISNDFVP